MTNPSSQYEFSYGAFRPLLSVMGMGPRWSGVELGPDAMRVRMGWAFHTRVPRSAIQGASPRTRMVGGIGVHGWAGRWLVNGSTKGVVAIDIDPPARGYVMGFPVRLRQLAVGLADPEGFLAAIGS